MKIAQILRETSLFEALSDAQLKDISLVGEIKGFEAGEEVFKQGEAAKMLYVLLYGSVLLKTETREDRLDPTAEILDQTGAVFGMAALTKSRTYNVTALCTEDSAAFALDSTELREIIRREPSLGLEVMAELAQLYVHRLNFTRAAVKNLYKIFRSQVTKPEIYDVYAECG
jgi:CRP-like cAMP-binding protein